MRLSESLFLQSNNSEITNSLSDIFEEEPVDLTTFIQDHRFLNNPPLSPVQYEAVRHIEQVYYVKTCWDMANEFGPYWIPVRPINFAIIQWGKGSGKDHISRVSCLRIAYLLMCLKSPQNYFGIPAQDTIHMLNVASSAGQAQNAFFKPMTRIVKKGWFESKAEATQNLIRFTKNVEAISGHSEAESLEGNNLILGVADEIDAFKSKEEIERSRGKSAREPANSADGILKMLRTSASTRFPETYKNVVISYPRFKGSTIQRLTREAKARINTKGKDSRHYVSGPLCTWDVNPNVKGKEAFEEDYEEDPVMAKAMYECDPAHAISPWFRNEDAVDSAIDIPELQPITINYKLEKNQFGVQVWNVDFDFKHTFVPIQGARYAVHGDIGITADRAGLAMSHIVSQELREYVGHDEEGGEVVQFSTLPHVQTDFVIAFEASLKQEVPREVQVRWYRDLIYELQRRGFSIGRATFDGYQSTDAIQQLESRGIVAEVLSMDRSDIPWKTWRDMILEGRWYGTIDDIARSEILALSKQPNGKIDHPPGGSKDKADAICGSVISAIEAGGMEMENKPQAYPGSTQFAIATPYELPRFTLEEMRPVGFELDPLR